MNVQLLLGIAIGIIAIARGTYSLVAELRAARAAERPPRRVRVVLAALSVVLGIAVLIVVPIAASR